TTTTDLVSRYYAAFNAKDWKAMATCVSEQINHFVNEGDKRGGRKAFAEFIAHMDDCYDELLTDIVVMASPDGARASAEFIVNGTYKKTDPGLPEARGQTYRLPAGAFFDVQNGEITRVTTYYNLKEWIRQVS
ncbi:MAG TPA: ketosteroid isomerase-related protein, partial [Hyphomonas sp.]|nr:ketosteroid isomerase-related protein [Hyphomonas sp.]